MKIKFLGASSGIVTGSSYVLTSESGKAILIDLGMFQGTPDVDKLNYLPYDYDASKLVGAVLTHAHLDHCGRLPIILPMGFNGDFYMTPATRDLTELSLYDTAKIAKNDGKQILFNRDLVAKTVSKFKTVEFHESFQIGDFEIMIRDAGHIMGSGSLQIEDKSATSDIKKIIFSGDLGNSPEPLEKETETFSEADAVVMESTYGDRLHPAGSPADVIQSEINEIEEKGGTLLIPAFSLERTQEILHLIMHLKKERKILENTPIYLDSPMAEKATEIYMRYKENFNGHILDDMKSGSPFEFMGLEIIGDGRQSEEIKTLPGAKVIIAGSGMMVGGRIVGHAAYFLPIPSTRLLIVGYQGEGTLGRELMEGNKLVNIDGEDVKINAYVNNIQTMSSHADQGQLVNWLKNIKGIKKLFITHGEDVARKALSEKINQELGIKDIILPVLSQEVEF